MPPQPPAEGARLPTPGLQATRARVRVNVQGFANETVHSDGKDRGAVLLQDPHQHFRRRSNQAVQPGCGRLFGGCAHPWINLKKRDDGRNAAGLLLATLVDLGYS